MPHDVKLESLIGTWNLSEYMITDQDGVVFPLWESIRGRLIYTRDGYVSVVIVRQAEKIGIGDVICYSGSFVIEGNHVKHSIHVSTVKRYQDAIEVRRVESQDGLLILKLETHPSGQIHTVRWSRV